MFKKFIVISMVMLFANSQSVFASSSENGDVGNLHDITRADNGVFIAVGESGTIVKSVDGEKWEKVNINQKENINAVVSNNSAFYAVGDKGTILRSVGGDKWENVKFKVNLTLKDMVNKRYIANYSKKDLSLTITNANVSLRDIIWTGKQYVAIGKIIKPDAENRNYVYQIIVHSTDGVNWKLRKFEVTNLTSNKADASRSNADLNAIYWNGDRYVVTGDDLIFTSKDLNQWTSSSNIQGDIRDLIYREKQWITVGWDGRFSEPKGVIYTSKDGMNWSSVEQKKVFV
ncbi:WD40/YVTN/BNR-like repeat-containing protein [Paenibacillus terrigena]|uniref:WD40/YVTN/BNR-like repeat-containing protein n=1 Tax=Paenibacillus terrigena TaxID=369333 RepID=UPI00036A218B|nr:hypothetical protein [Paenibacillus terrigena]